MLKNIRKTIATTLIIGTIFPMTAIAAPTVKEDVPVDLNEWVDIYANLQYPDLYEDDGYGYYQVAEETPVYASYISTEPSFFGAAISNKVYNSKRQVVRGVIIEETVPGGPAKKGGLRSGDLITEFNGFTVNNTDEFLNLLSETRPGQKIVITITNPTEKGFVSEDYIIVLGKADVSKHYITRPNK